MAGGLGHTHPPPYRQKPAPVPKNPTPLQGDPFKGGVTAVSALTAAVGGVRPSTPNEATTHGFFA
jgi:hypothetical protein